MMEQTDKQRAMATILAAFERYCDDYSHLDFYDGAKAELVDGSITLDGKKWRLELEQIDDTK